ncbi:hypothetical protein [Mitsuaria sp. GD03876]|uniref:hypothetical protein n=1 Tax=Mitsuaria sp. GD03876 TaxID=2975399 RepID=UPI00244895F9|nr:hypothetical protein [Mitsuaria sp. GD03876]MDH0862909.1 hypothetical protein [Mitsuaria sp. GD03876]
MELLKENWIRLAYGAVSICIAWAAYSFRVEVLSDKDTFDRFAYIGGVATFIGLLITVSEVLHAIGISKGIRAEARALLAEARKIDRAALFSECLLMIDRINDDLIGGRFSTALQGLQQVRRSFLRASTSNSGTDPLSAKLAGVEELLQGSIRMAAMAPRSKRDAVEIQEGLLAAKQILEHLIAGRTDSHAA